MNKYLIVIVGPTGIGKTELASHLAKAYQTEIISADSRQFYKDLNVGVAKPSDEELREIKHHFIDSISIHDKYNAGQYEKEALECLKGLFEAYDKVIMTGGSGLFIDAVCKGFDHLPPADEDIRNNLESRMEEHGIKSLQAELKNLDQDYYQKVDLNNPRRLIRALEVCMITGEPYSSLINNRPSKRPFKICKIGLNINRNDLYDLINKRIDKMIENGLVDEVRTFYPHKHLISLQAIGYTEVFDFIDGKYDLDEAISLIKRNSRRYAKRQLTWFRKDQDIKWFEPAGLGKIKGWLSSRVVE
ncbi:tRNA (adenosine(37)-N6)-dimethylallyltransferase MiaA [Candidatus Amoebophilus asiaticus]|nr:tRNA (adenosine(37)-N6)-dimethylallyltransferase MiaA [Candidatus Amoebophilus asiaticus]